MASGPGASRAGGTAVGKGPVNPARRDQTVGAYLASWLGHMRSRVRARTSSGYESLIRLYVLRHIGEIKLARLEPLDVQDLYASLLKRDPPLATGTVLNLHLVLHNAFAQAVRWGLIAANPVAGAQPPRPSRGEPRTVDAALARRILEAARGT